jgi:hypothetical protein
MRTPRAVGWNSCGTGRGAETAPPALEHALACVKQLPSLRPVERTVMTGGHICTSPHATKRMRPTRS